MNSTLQTLGLKYSTDKSGIFNTHKFNNKSFLNIYERYFKYFKNTKINFLEMGILNGSSLKVWEEYFSHASIVGLDIDPSKKQYETEKTKIFIGSQIDKTVINEIKKQYPDKFAVILDDASHLNDLTIKSFEMLFDHVVPGGLYIIEDTHCTYGVDDYGEDEFVRLSKNWPGMNFNDTNTNYNNNRKTFLNFILPKITDLDHKKGDIFSINFFAETLIIEKTQ